MATSFRSLASRWVSRAVRIASRFSSIVTCSFPGALRMRSGMRIGATELTASKNLSRNSRSRRPVSGVATNIELGVVVAVVLLGPVDQPECRRACDRVAPVEVRLQCVCDQHRAVRQIRYCLAAGCHRFSGTKKYIAPHRVFAVGALYVTIILELFHEPSFVAAIGKVDAKQCKQAGDHAADYRPCRGWYLR